MVYMDMPGSFILFQTREKMPQLNYVMLKKEKEKKKPSHLMLQIETRIKTSNSRKQSGGEKNNILKRGNSVHPG